MADAYRISNIEPDLTETLRQAVEYHRQGQLEAAERFYGFVLTQAPDHSDALHFLGVLHHQRGNSAEALRCIAAALRSNPASAEILTNYAFMLDAVGRPTEALAAYDKALIIRPNDVDALFNRGNAQVRLGRFQQAARSFEDVLSIKPDHVGALNNLGTAFRSLGRNEEALASFSKALAIQPNDVVALKNCGTTLQGLDRHAEALTYFDKALAVDARQVDVLCNRAHSLRELGRFDAALASFEEALRVDPRHVPSLYNRGNLLRSLGRHQDAVANYDTALAVQPDSAEILFNQGNALVDLLRLEEAVTRFDGAVAIDPKFAPAFNNRAMALARLRRDDEALASFARARSLAPDNAEFNFNEGVARLRAGDFVVGWARCESRLQLHDGALARQFGSPSWRGETSLRGRTILLHGEQDLGDTVQFVRYVAPIVAAGGRVVLEVQPELTDLMAGVAGISAVVSRGDKVPAHDLNCPLPSLPLACSTTLNSIPAVVPYIRAPTQRVQAWTTCLLQLKPPLVGFFRGGDVDSKTGHERSIALERFLPLLDHARARFISLQGKLPRADAMQLAQQPCVSPLSAEMRGYTDIAAVISLLDLVVTVDGPIAHLAGALGRPVWILLPFYADYRWMLDRDDSPWYPTARLFRQPAAGDWDSVIAAVHQAMARHAF